MILTHKCIVCGLHGRCAIVYSERERETQFREKLSQVAVVQHRLRADLRAQEAEAEETIRFALFPAIIRV